MKSTIITFYSFKGGVGRTAAVANIAVILASRNLKVLAVDWDLEAPGLDAFLDPDKSSSETPSLIDLLHAQLTLGESNWRDHITSLNIAGSSLDLIKAGDPSKADYIQKLATFEWPKLFEEPSGADFIESLRSEWLAAYDAILIDSRTGLSDGGGVCTIQLADAIIGVASASRQSIDGLAISLLMAQKARANLPYDRPPAVIVPLLSKWDGRAEVEMSERWLATFTTTFEPFMRRWLPPSVSAVDLITRLKIPHVPRFSFGEELAVIGHSLEDAELPGLSYSLMASLIEANWRVSESVFNWSLDTSIDQLDAAASLLRSGSQERHSYLRRVTEEHFFLDIGSIGANFGALIPLDDVVVPFITVEEAAPQGGLRRLDQDWELREIEERFADGRISIGEFEAEIDRLVGPSGHANRLPGDTTPSNRARVELGAVVASERRLVLLGDPGCGKTTLGRWLARSHAAALLEGRDEVGIGGPSDWRMPACFPIFASTGSLLELSDWRTLPLMELLVSAHRSREYSEDRPLSDLFEQSLRSGTCLLIVDGLDEIPSADDRRDMAMRIRSFVERWTPAGNRFLLTSRSAGYDSAPVSGFRHFIIDGMDRASQTRLIELYCSAIERIEQPESEYENILLQARERAARIQSAIETSRGIARLATNPLLLTLLIWVERDRASIPDQRAKAYELGLRLLEGRWRIEQGVDGSELPSRHLLRRVLVTLAAWVHENKPAGLFSLDDVVDAVGHVWANEQRLEIERQRGGSWPAAIYDELEAFVARVCLQNGILVEVAPQRWSFLHRTFQEYYAAVKLVEDARPAVAIRSRLHNPRYTEPILLALGIISHVQIRRDAGDLFDAAILGLGPLADGDAFRTNSISALSRRDLDFAYLAAGDDVEINRWTLNYLASDPWACPRDYRLSLRGTQLGRLLLDRFSEEYGNAKSDELRVGAAEALGQLGETSRALDLLSTLASSQHQDIVRVLAARALIELGNPALSISGLLYSISADPRADSRARILAAEAVQRLGDLDSARQILLELTDPHNPAETRLAAAHALVRAGGSKAAAIEVLKSILLDPHSDTSTLVEAAEALVQFGELKLSLEVLLGLVEPESPLSARLSAARALAQLGGFDSVVARALLPVWQDPLSDQRTMLAAAEVLAQLGEPAPGVQRFLTRLALDSSFDEDVRVRAATALSGVDRNRWLGIARSDDD